MKVYCKIDYTKDYVNFKKGEIYKAHKDEVYDYDYDEYSGCDDYYDYDYGYIIFNDMNTVLISLTDFKYYFEFLEDRRKRIISEI